MQRWFHTTSMRRAGGDVEVVCIPVKNLISAWHQHHISPVKTILTQFTMFTMRLSRMLPYRRIQQYSPSVCRPRIRLPRSVCRSLQHALPSRLLRLNVGLYSLVIRFSCFLLSSLGSVCATMPRLRGATSRNCQRAMPRMRRWIWLQTSSTCRDEDRGVSPWMR
jgi:hypothetical protein